jgi:isopentenyl-diphosphate Delta-isomerase
MSTQAEETIVFVNEAGEPTGETGPKLASHHDHTKLHLAFSCYIFNDDGKLLVTRRALNKKVWPGVWSNSVCGHLQPGETFKDAIKRRAQYELGMKVDSITCILRDYRYTTPPYNGIIENEFCPVFVAKAGSHVKPNPDEVADYYWISWPEYVIKMERHAKEFSYWAKDQYPRLSNSPSFNAFLTSLS